MPTGTYLKDRSSQSTATGPRFDCVAAVVGTPLACLNTDQAISPNIRALRAASERLRTPNLS